MLQLQDLRVGQAKESCIGLNTRELNRELCTRLSILYSKNRIKENKSKIKYK